MDIKPSLQFASMMVPWQHLKANLKDAIPRAELAFPKNFLISFGIVDFNVSNLIK